ncbi:hypothetical protein M413DRAFT_433216, partial [Hebeloma cylindrosporum]
MRSPSSLSSSTNNSNSFFNLYFLLVALSQFVPALKIGFIVTYIAPLAFVLCVTMGKEAYDDYKRNMRDREANSQRYLILTPPPSPQSYSDEEQAYLNTHANTRSVPPSYLRVGDLVHLVKNSEFQQTWYCSTPPKPRGHVSIRTDQLDGETDWKLRVAVPECQKMDEGDLVKIDA